MSAIALSHPVPSRRAPRGALWVVQALLAAAFAFVGVMKLTQPVAALAAQLPWVATAPEALVRCIGAAELAGALGLVLPELTRVRPRLTMFAAWGRGAAAPVAPRSR